MKNLNFATKFKFVLIVCGFLVFSCKTTSYNTPASTASYGVDKGDEFFSIAVLPDTQYYTALRNGGTMDMFEDQINWIRNNRKSENIQYVIHLGDITDHNASEEWDRAKSVLYKLDEDNIPYGLTVGNHDETPNGSPSQGSDKTDYTKYFGKSHFKDRKWYGGGMGGNDNSDNHFDLFTANGIQFIALYFVFNEPGNPQHNPAYEKVVMQWADSVLSKYPDRKAIMVAHSMLNRVPGSPSEIKPGSPDNKAPKFTRQGQVIYDMAKNHSNVFLMLGGHISGEGFRKDTFNGNTIKTYLTDYQFRQKAPYSGVQDRNGGGGLMRLLKFNTTKQTIVATTFAPLRTGLVKEDDADSQFIEPLFK
ncbi:MAG: hypothetical protein K0S09_3206 [Sphingobacteriaceae bacterium]|jgi:hypothetical protein|nr:hypothetical protein [Sphingobacteriaceae bacterium]